MISEACCRPCQIFTLAITLRLELSSCLWQPFVSPRLWGGGGHFYHFFPPWRTNKNNACKTDVHSRKSPLTLDRDGLTKAMKGRWGCPHGTWRMGSSKEGSHCIFLPQVWWFSSWDILDAVSLLAKGSLTTQYWWTKQKGRPHRPSMKEPWGPTYRFRVLGRIGCCKLRLASVSIPCLAWVQLHSLLSGSRCHLLTLTSSLNSQTPLSFRISPSPGINHGQTCTWCFSDQKLFYIKLNTNMFDSSPDGRQLDPLFPSPAALTSTPWWTKS